MKTRVLLKGGYHEFSVDKGVAVIQRQRSSRRRPYVSTSQKVSRNFSKYNVLTTRGGT